MREIERIEEEIEGLKKQLQNHPLYTELQNIEHIQTFMEAHVFCCMGFYVAVEALQRKMTCIELPWVPAKNAITLDLSMKLFTEKKVM